MIYIVSTWLNLYLTLYPRVNQRLSRSTWDHDLGGTDGVVAVCRALRHGGQQTCKCYNVISPFRYCEKKKLEKRGRAKETRCLHVQPSINPSWFWARHWYVSNVFHACFISMPYVFTIILYHFEAFYWTNLLTRCMLLFPCFCHVFIAETYFWKYSRNWTKIYGDFFIE